MQKVLAVVAAVVFVLGSGWVSAGVVYDNGPPNLAWSGFFSDFDGAFNGTPQQCADMFTLPVAATVRDVHWWGMYVDTHTPPTVDDWTIRLFALQASNGLPEMDPFYEYHAGDIGRTFTGQQTAGAYDLYKFEIDIPPVTLAAGAYALSVVNDTPTIADDWSWHNNVGVGGPSAIRNFDTEAWESLSVDFAFYLTDDIPEPATLSLLALGGLGLLRRRRRRRA